MPNRLHQEKSPYLAQHAGNPVDWYPWGAEAFERARSEDKPIFLSIGYSTCHWCHVMEHESFEDPEVARLLNEHMVAIKVDREERPDVDDIYMKVCQVLMGRGGWPLSIFMGPDGRPFFAGTYFPKENRMGMSGFKDIIQAISRLWRQDRDRLLQASEKILAAISEAQSGESIARLGLDTLETGYRQLRSLFDARWGGFGHAPKFPTPHQLTFLLRYHLRHPDSEGLDMVEKTLAALRDGGIFDQIGLGFHRYSVDERWLVPHFEKMLYDQALLAMAYLEAFQLTGRRSHADAARDIFEYVLRDMQGDHGGFYSAEDADSEGVEGLFYVWTPDQVKAVLGEERAELFCDFYDITAAGNFEDHRSILHRPKSVESFARSKDMHPETLESILEASRKALYAEREKRTHPLKDDKVLASWNGLMIAALAGGFRATGEMSWLQAAIRAADFVAERLIDASGRLHRRYRDGEVAHLGCLDDYAFFVWGLLELYEASLDARFLQKALALNEDMLRLFWDEATGACFFTGSDGERLIMRDKPVYDGATPSGNSVAALNLLRLGRMTGDTRLEQRGEQILRFFSAQVAEHPSAYTQLLNALDFALGPGQEVIIVGDAAASDFQEMLRTVHRTFGPRRVLVGRLQGPQSRDIVNLCPYVAALTPAHDGGARVYLCENQACREPIDDPESLRRILGR